MVHSVTFLVGQGVAAQTGGGGGIMQVLLLLIPMIAVMYFLMIRPERKRQSDHQGMVGSLKRGDEIVLTSGFLGKIHAIEDKTLVVEIGDKVRVKVLKVAVSGLSSRYLGGAEGKPTLSDPKKDEKKDDKKDDAAEKKSA
jgi:preprotein translocase subunit YajC